MSYLGQTSVTDEDMNGEVIHLAIYGFIDLHYLQRCCLHVVLIDLSICVSAMLRLHHEGRGAVR